MVDTSISISPTTAGVPSRSDPTDGGSQAPKIASAPSALSVQPAVLGLGAITPSLLELENKRRRADDADAADANFLLLSQIYYGAPYRDGILRLVPSWDHAMLSL